MMKKFFHLLIWTLVFSAAVACGKSSEPGPEPEPVNPVTPELLDLAQVAAFNDACNYVSSVAANSDGTMVLTLLRNDETVTVTADDLAAGLKVEDKGRYFVFTMPGQDPVVLGSDVVMPYNPPIRRIAEGATLNILCIGNSLTGDTVEHLPRMLQEMGITNVNIDVIYHGGWSLLNHWTNFQDIKCSRYIYEAGQPDWTEFNPNLLDDCGAEVLALRDYDVVVLQDDTRTNCTGWSADARTAFGELVDYIYRAHPTHRPSLVYFVPHCPAAKLYGTSNIVLWELFEGDQAKCYEAFISQLKDASTQTPVDLFFSNATAVQNLRTSDLNKSHPLDLSRDGTHSDYGVTRFCESTMFFQYIIKPSLGVDISQSHYTFDKSDATAGKCSTPVDDTTRPIAIEAAANALKEPFQITRMSEEEPPVEGLVNYQIKWCDYPILLEKVPDDACTIKNAGTPVGIDWEISGTARGTEFRIVDGSANNRYKIGADANYIDPFVLKTQSLAGKKISRVAMWMSTGAASISATVSISIGGKEYLPPTEVKVSTTATKSTGIEYAVDCDGATDGEVEITIRATGAFYIYKTYIDYE